MSHAFDSRVVASMRRVWGSFGSPRGLGADAIYVAADGAPPVNLRVMPVVQDTVLDNPFQARTLQTARYFDMLVPDVPSRPGKGATLSLVDAAGAVIETYKLTEAAQSVDSLRNVWRCMTSESA